jgi:hypothetical protein
MLSAVDVVWHRRCQIYRMKEELERLHLAKQVFKRRQARSLEEKDIEQETIDRMAFGVGCAHSELADNRRCTRTSRMESIRRE